MLDGQWKYIVRRTRNAETRHLFRIFEDPSEEVDLITEFPYEANRLAQILANHPNATSEPPTIAAVVNGASFTPVIAPQSWVTIVGERLAGETRSWGPDDFDDVLLPTALEGVSVTIDTEPAFVYFVSPTQINVLSPASSASGPVVVEVTTWYGTSQAFVAEKQLVAPALFLFDPEERRYAAAVHPDGILAAKTGLWPTLETRPVRPGEPILLYGSGVGPTSPAVNESEIVSAPSPLANETTIRFGETVAQVEFAGVVSNGLCQFNVVVPNLPPGDVAITATVLGVTSAPAFLTIAD